MRGLAGSRSGISQTSWQEEELLRSVVDWAILYDVSFLNASSAELRVLLSWNRQDLLRALPSSPSTLSKYVLQGLTERKETVRTLLRTSISKIALSLDVWTSPNHHSFLGVVAHFVGENPSHPEQVISRRLTRTDASSAQRDVLVAFKNLLGDHTGLHQGLNIVSVIREYDLADQVHCFVADNASNNDQTFINSVNQRLKTDFTLDSRIRCAGHIIAIVVKAVIYGKGVSKFEAELAQAAPGEQFELHRRYGVVGKLHNFVNAVLVSHKRRELFKAVQIELADEDPLWTFGTLNLVQDGGIRWNSVYFMILRCIELREPISRFIRKLRRTEKVDNDDNSSEAYDPLTDELSDEEWEAVERLKNFLERFYRATLKLEGKTSTSQYGALWQTILQLQLLDEHLRGALNASTAIDASESRDQPSYLTTAASYGLERLTTYWEKLILDPDVSYYCVALALHPAARLLWFKDHWRHHETWHKKAECSIKKAFQQYLQREDSREDEQPTIRKVPRLGRIDDGDPDLTAILSVDTSLLTGNKGHKKLKRQSELQLYFDEIAQDVAEGREDLQYPLIWWQTVGHKRYPTLHQMALDYLSIPATSCECERAFSAAKRTISVDRNRLAPATIEAIQLQKHWLRAGVVNSELISLSKRLSRSEDPPDDVQALDQVIDGGYRFGGILADQDLDLNMDSQVAYDDSFSASFST